MQLLIDTDAFIKLGISGLFNDTLDLLNIDLNECGRLPALTYMLRKGSVPRLFGVDLCNKLIPLAESIPVLDQPRDSWLDKLKDVHDIDPGEAQIIAVAAESRLLVITGDKRALLALKSIANVATVLAGRIITIEAILILMCDQFGQEYVRERVRVISSFDTMIEVCFSTGNPEPREALLSYYQNLVVEVDPLILWNPSLIGEA
ncbi:hypothetical protein CEE37_06810 [candidate division LCP-89 bacterium B3_LCP]|uniref:Uncharacterized protein n=1 Tax=candidate division LCP-89 bacterium B3_LCP TaxID=2012998 RepID=A0A532V0H1_UNCL8|nr:MAG: hypothetical protein CEE37_06810 [candidate division LCP-89 bacterium B3_LCP]